MYSASEPRVDEIVVDRIFDQQLRLAIIHGHGPESVHRRILTIGERQSVVGLAAIERLTVGIAARYRVCRFRGNVAVDACFRAGCTQQPIAVVERAVAEPTS